LLGHGKIESTGRHLGIEGAARVAPPDQSMRRVANTTVVSRLIDLGDRAMRDESIN
jgi:hypothetical protein